MPRKYELEVVRPDGTVTVVPARVRMVVVELDGTRSPVEPFNRDTQKIREKEAGSFGPLHPFNT